MSNHNPGCSPFIQMELFPASDYTQRWRERRHAWRHRSEGGFNRAEYEIAAIPDDTTARAFVCTHHYSGTYPAARLRYGLYTRGGMLIGVAVLSVPSQAKVLTSVFPELAPYDESLELGRFILLDMAPANSESHFLSQVWKQASREGIQGIVSFSDPVARTTSTGEIVFGGHIGTIYQASNALYLGRATPRTLTVLPNGQVFNDRAMQKVRGQEQGADYGERQLVECGARSRAVGEDPRLCLRQALKEIGVRQIRHPGNHRYAFRIGRWRKSIRIGLIPYSYPKMMN
jgi:hypothetical protein